MVTGYCKVTIETNDGVTASTHSLTYYNEPDSPAVLALVLAALLGENYSEHIKQIRRELAIRS